MFDPQRMHDNGCKVKLFRGVQEEGTFLYVVPRAYHYGFNCGFNVTETVNYATVPWLEVGRLEAKVGLNQRINNSVSLPWEYIAIREARYLMELYAEKGTAGLDVWTLKEARQVLESLKVFIRYSQRVLLQRKHTQKREIAAITEKELPFPFTTQTATKALFCSVCHHACFMYVELCSQCMSSHWARCINHPSDVCSDICSIPGHHSVLVERFTAEQLAGIVSKLEEIASKFREVGTDGDPYAVRKDAIANAHFPVGRGHPRPRSMAQVRKAKRAAKRNLERSDAAAQTQQKKSKQAPGSSSGAN